WSCEARHGPRSCSVACFDDAGPEYLVSFDDDGQMRAQGRTRTSEETLDAVADWLGGCDVLRLYDWVAFVDRPLLALGSLAIEVEGLQSRLVGCRDLRHDMADLYHLWFTAGDRACEVSFYGDNESPDATFHWEGCELFQFVVGDAAVFAAVLARWL